MPLADLIVTLADLRAAVKAYRAALAQYESWQLAIDEDDPIDGRAARALNRLYADKQAERDAVQRAARRVMDEAMRLADMKK